MTFKDLRLGDTFRFTTKLGYYILHRKISEYQYTRAGEDLEKENREQREYACVYGYPLPKLPLRYTVGTVEVEVIKS